MEKKYTFCGICGLPIINETKAEYLKGFLVHIDCEIKPDEKREFNDDGYGYKK